MSYLIYDILLLAYAYTFSARTLFRDLHLGASMLQEGPATHLFLVLFECRSYETKPDFAGPPRCEPTATGSSKSTAKFV
jgi:hypothetical protein